MPTDPIAPRPRRRSRLRIFLPTLILAVLAVAWSGFWFFAEGKAGEAIDRFIASEAQKGRVITCAQRTTGGFPFRLEVRCESPRLEVARDDGTFTITAGRFLAVAQAYAPNHIVAEIAGPFAFARHDIPRTLEATWKSAEASLVFDTSGPQRLAVVIDGLDAALVENGERHALVGGAHAESYLRVAEGANAAPGAYDVAGSLDAASAPDVDAFFGAPAAVKAEMQGVVTGVLDLAPKPFDERLREWSAAGGVLRIARARVDRGPSSVMASGNVALDPEGQPAGRLAVTIAGVEDLAAALKQAGIVPANLSNLLGVGLSLLGKPANIDGRAAIEVPVKMAEGRASIGSFPAGRLPRLFNPDTGAAQ